MRGCRYVVTRETFPLIFQFWDKGFGRVMGLNPDSWDQIVEGDDEGASSTVIFLISLLQFYNGELKFPDNKIEMLYE